MLKNIFALFLGIFINAQTNSFVINGLVSNDQNKPIPNASIKLKDDTYEYTLNTDEKGTFSKKLYSVGEKIYVNINSKGYDEVNVEVFPNQRQYIFILQPKSQEIEEVVIQKGVIQKGDSTIYNADYYSNKKENKVIDLLKKLPNVDVSRNGKIVVNGKEVSKVLVENETFFTGSSSLAINSLPANVVERFEVIDNYKENSTLGGESDRTVLNIALKEEKKKIVFGDIFLGGNSYDRYKAGANLFYYTPKTKINFISNLNNTNESTFTIEDYFAFNGGMDRLLRDPMAFMGNINAKELLALIEPTEKYYNKQVFNALNLSNKMFKDKFKLSVFNINNRNISKEIKENTMRFNQEKIHLFERKEDVSRDIITENNSFNLVLENTNTEKLDFYYNLSLKNTNIEIDQNKKITLFNRENNHQSIEENKGLIINQVADFNYNFLENHAQRVLLNFLISENKTQNIANSDSRVFFHSIFNLVNNHNVIQQNTNDWNKQFRINFQHKYNFFTHHQVGLGINFIYKKQKIGNKFYVNNNVNDWLSSSMNLSRNNTNLSLEYLFKNRYFTISLIGDFISVDSKFSSDKTHNLTRNFFLLPMAKIEYKNRSLGVFNLEYQKSIQDIYAHYYYVGNYLVSNTYLFNGITRPNNPITEKIVFKYKKKSGYYGYDIDFKYRFSNKLKDYITDTKTTSLLKTNTIYFFNNVGSKNDFDIKLEKQIFNKKISIVSYNSIGFDKQQIKINGIDSYSYTSSRYFNLAIKSRFKGNYNFEVYNNYNIINYKNILAENTYRMNEMGMLLNFHLAEKFSINADFSLNVDLENNTSYSKSVLKLDYYLNSNIYANLFINNIFGSYKKMTIANEEFLSYYQRENLMPHFFYVGLTYKF